MKMVEVKVSELSGAALDYAVGVAVAGKPIECSGSVARWKFTMLEASVWGGDIELGDIERYQPSTVWGDVGPLIEKYNIQTSYNGNGFPRSPTGKYWCAYVCKPHGPEELPSGGGSTPLIAACRAIVASKFGDTVSVPAELVEGV